MSLDLYLKERTKVFLVDLEAFDHSLRNYMASDKLLLIKLFRVSKYLTCFSDDSEIAFLHLQNRFLVYEILDGKELSFLIIRLKVNILNTNEKTTNEVTF